MSILPPLPAPPPANLLLFSTQQWNWLTKALAAVYAAHEAELDVLGAIVNSQEALMATVQELQNALDRNTASTEAAAAAIQTEIDQLKAAIDALSTSQPPTQAQIDQLNAASDKLEQATAALGADDPSAAPPA